MEVPRLLQGPWVATEAAFTDASGNSYKKATFKITVLPCFYRKTLNSPLELLTGLLRVESQHLGTDSSRAAQEAPPGACFLKMYFGKVAVFHESADEKIVFAEQKAVTLTDDKVEWTRSAARTNPDIAVTWKRPAINEPRPATTAEGSKHPKPFIIKSVRKFGIKLNGTTPSTGGVPSSAKAPTETKQLCACGTVACVAETERLRQTLRNSTCPSGMARFERRPERDSPSTRRKGAVGQTPFRLVASKSRYYFLSRAHFHPIVRTKLQVSTTHWKSEQALISELVSGKFNRSDVKYFKNVGGDYVPKPNYPIQELLALAPRAAIKKLHRLRDDDLIEYANIEKLLNSSDNMECHRGALALARLENAREQATLSQPAPASQVTKPAALPTHIEVHLTINLAQKKLKPKRPRRENSDEASGSLTIVEDDTATMSEDGLDSMRNRSGRSRRVWDVGAADAASTLFPAEPDDDVDDSDNSDALDESDDSGNSGSASNTTGVSGSKRKRPDDGQSPESMDANAILGWSPQALLSVRSAIHDVVRQKVARVAPGVQWKDKLSNVHVSSIRKLKDQRVRIYFRIAPFPRVVRAALQHVTILKVDNEKFASLVGQTYRKRHEEYFAKVRRHHSAARSANERQCRKLETHSRSSDSRTEAENATGADKEDDDLDYVPLSQQAAMEVEETFRKNLLNTLLSDAGKISLKVLQRMCRENDVGNSGNKNHLKQRLIQKLRDSGKKAAAVMQRMKEPPVRNPGRRMDVEGETVGKDFGIGPHFVSKVGLTRDGEC